MTIVDFSFSNNQNSKQFELKSGFKKSFIITTSYENQERGILNIDLSIQKPILQKTHIRIASIEIKGIPPAKAGEINITVNIESKDANSLEIEIAVPGQKESKYRIDLKPSLKKLKHRLLLSVLDVIVLLVLCSLFLAIAITNIFNTTGNNTTGNNTTDNKRKASNTTYSNTTVPSIPDVKTTPATPVLKKPHIPIKPNTPNSNERQLKYTVYFLPDSDALTTETKKTLKSLVATLNQMQKQKSIYSLSIEGHCALYGTERGRFILSERRAYNVYIYLKEHGWSPDKKPTIKGFGGSKPYTLDPKKQQLNRRVEIIIKR